MIVFVDDQITKMIVAQLNLRLGVNRLLAIFVGPSHL